MVDQCNTNSIHAYSKYASFIDFVGRLGRQ